MGHERSITIQDEAGNWINVYGPGNDSGRPEGERLPLTPNYSTSEEAVAAAKERSKRSTEPMKPVQPPARIKEGDAVLGRRASMPRDEIKPEDGRDSRSAYAGPQLLAPAPTDPRPKSFANYRLSDDAARRWAAYLDSRPQYEPTPAARKVMAQQREEDLTRARGTEITEDMSPTEREMVMRWGRPMHDAHVMAATMGAPAGWMGLARPRSEAFNDPTLRSLDHAAMVLGAIPGVQSNVAARTGLLKGAQTAAPEAAPVVTQAARSAATMTPQMQRTYGLDLLIQQLRRQLGMGGWGG